MIKNPLVIKLFRFFWGQRLSEGDKIAYVTGWRSCLYDKKNWGSRLRTIFLIKVFGHYL